MNAFRPKRSWFWIAVAAIAIAVIALLLPHGGNADQHAWVALLPVFFVGLVAPLSVRRVLALLTIEHAPEAPTLAPSFQRPPPSAA
jgi:hypothetical protein